MTEAATKTEKATVEAVVRFEDGKWQVNGEGNFSNKMAAYARVEEIRGANPDSNVRVQVFKKDGSIQLEVTKARGSKVVVGRVQEQTVRQTEKAVIREAKLEAQDAAAIGVTPTTGSIRILLGQMC
jgi:hypothetical protein